MKEPQEQTFLARLGFNDPELKSKKHDEMMLWLDSRAESFAREIVNCPAGWTAESIKWCEESARLSVGARKTEMAKYAGYFIGPGDHNARQRAVCNAEIDLMASFAGLGDPPEYSVRIKRIWEQPITKRSNGADPGPIVGFVDMVAEVDVPRLQTEGIVYDRPVGGTTLPRWRAAADFKYERTSIGFEVKPDIDSLGALIRQLRAYELHRSWKFYVVSPRAEMAATLSQQGFGFVSYPEGKITKPASQTNDASSEASR